MTRYLLVLLIIISSSAVAQNDTLIFQNNDIMVGEVKELLRGVIQIETPYSDADFTIDFDEIREIKIQRKCVVVLTNGEHRYAKIATDSSGKLKFILEDGSIEYHGLHEIVALQTVKNTFWKRLEADVDLGYNLTKSNSNSRFTISSLLTYKSEKIISKFSINLLRSAQKNAQNVDRADAKLEFIRILAREWYLLGDVSFLSNTEQELDSRISPSLGAGNLLIATDKLYLAVSAGFTFNAENYFNSTLDKNSAEVFLGLAFNMFDFSDVDLDTGLKMYPSLTESGRFRADFNIVTKFDLPLDFYFKLGYTFNYDNQPAVVGNDFDYILTTGFGWSFN